MILRSPQLGALQSLARLAVIRVGAHQLGVFSDRDVVVLGHLGVAGDLDRAAAAAAGARHQRHRDKRGQGHARRAAERLLGTATIGHDIHAAWNAKLKVFIGQTPVFLQVAKVNDERPPWVSTAVRNWI